jgi:hypothetical protein
MTFPSPHLLLFALVAGIAFPVLAQPVNGVKPTAPVVTTAPATPGSSVVTQPPAQPMPANGSAPAAPNGTSSAAPNAAPPATTPPAAPTPMPQPLASPQVAPPGATPQAEQQKPATPPSPTLSDLGRSLRNYFTEEELSLLFQYMKESVMASFKDEEVSLPPDLSFKLEILLVRMKKESGHYMDNLIDQMEKDLKHKLKEKLTPPPIKDQPYVPWYSR